VSPVSRVAANSLSEGVPFPSPAGRSSTDGSERSAGQRHAARGEPDDQVAADGGIARHLAEHAVDRGARRPGRKAARIGFGEPAPERFLGMSARRRIAWDEGDCDSRQRAIECSTGMGGGASGTDGARRSGAQRGHVDDQPGIDLGHHARLGPSGLGGGDPECDEPRARQGAQARRSLTESKAQIDSVDVHLLDVIGGSAPGLGATVGGRWSATASRQPAARADAGRGGFCR
jgi:hypothetical protein